MPKGLLAQAVVHSRHTAALCNKRRVAVAAHAESPLAPLVAAAGGRDHVWLPESAARRAAGLGVTESHLLVVRHSEDAPGQLSERAKLAGAGLSSARGQLVSVRLPCLADLKQLHSARRFLVGVVRRSRELVLLFPELMAPHAARSTSSAEPIALKHCGVAVTGLQAVELVVVPHSNTFAVLDQGGVWHWVHGSLNEEGQATYWRDCMRLPGNPTPLGRSARPVVVERTNVAVVRSTDTRVMLHTWTEGKSGHESQPMPDVMADSPLPVVVPDGAGRLWFLHAETCTLTLLGGRLDARPLGYPVRPVDFDASQADKPTAWLPLAFAGCALWSTEAGPVFSRVPGYMALSSRGGRSRARE